MIQPLSTMKVGTIVNNIRARNKSLSDIEYPIPLLIADVNNAIAELQAQGGFDYDDYNLQWTIPNTNDTVDLSIFEGYKLLRNVTHVNFTRVLRDGNIIDLCINVDEWVFETQRAYGGGSIYSNDVIWYRKNSKMFFWKGPEVGSYGQRIIYANRLPQFVENEMDYIDVKNDKISLVENWVEMKMLRRRDGFIDLQQAPRKIAQMDSTEQKDQLKSREK